MSNRTDRGRAPRRLPPIPVRSIADNAAPFDLIPELGAEALPAATLATLQALDHDTLEALAEIAINILDARAGDTEAEDDTEDCDESGDDVGSKDDRALSFNGLANAFHIAGINGGRHVAPLLAGATIFAWSEILAKADLPGRHDVGALRLRTVAAKDHPCADFPLHEGEADHPAVVLDLDYWVLMPR